MSAYWHPLTLSNLILSPKCVLVCGSWSIFSFKNRIASKHILSDFHSTFCIEKVISLHKKIVRNYSDSFKNIRPFPGAVPWSLEMLLDTRKVTVWCLVVSMGIPSINLKIQWIQKNHQKFLTFSQHFVWKKRIFLSRKLAQNVSNTHKFFQMYLVSQKMFLDTSDVSFGLMKSQNMDLKWDSKNTPESAIL